MDKIYEKGYNLIRDNTPSCISEKTKEFIKKNKDLWIKRMANILFRFKPNRKCLRIN